MNKKITIYLKPEVYKKLEEMTYLNKKTKTPNGLVRKIIMKSIKDFKFPEKKESIIKRKKDGYIEYIEI
jgi:hypothetical protein